MVAPSNLFIKKKYWIKHTANYGFRINDSLGVQTQRKYKECPNYYHKLTYFLKFVQQCVFLKY